MRLIDFSFDVNNIKTFIFLYKFTVYAILKDAVGKRVRMFYTDTN